MGHDELVPEIWPRSSVPNRILAPSVDLAWMSKRAYPWRSASIGEVSKKGSLLCLPARRASTTLPCEAPVESPGGPGLRPRRQSEVERYCGGGKLAQRGTNYGLEAMS